MPDKLDKKRSPLLAQVNFRIIGERERERSLKNKILFFDKFSKEYNYYFLVSLISSLKILQITKLLTYLRLNFKMLVNNN